MAAFPAASTDAVLHDKQYTAAARTAAKIYPLATLWLRQRLRCSSIPFPFDRSKSLDAKSRRSKSLHGNGWRFAGNPRLIQIPETALGGSRAYSSRRKKPRYTDKLNSKKTGGGGAALKYSVDEAVGGARQGGF